jgi:Leucine-rich repeat (LRR) protein
LKTRDTQTLILSTNKLTRLPSDFPFRFEELRALFLDHNQFTEFPVSICLLPHLEKLHIEFNAITRIPAEVKNWKYSLKKLYLSNNKLTDLPEELGELSMLQVLDIRNNQIKILPCQLAGRYGFDFES